MTRVWSIDHLASQLAGVVIERHVKKPGANARALSWRSRARTSKHVTEIAKGGCAEWRPAEEPSPKDTDRHCDGEFTFEPGKGGDGKRYDPAPHLDAACKHDRIGR